jgi:hypothetical protein
MFTPHLDVVPGVIFHPVLASRLRDVSAALLYLNGLYGVPTNSFPVECIIACPPNLNVPSVKGSFPSNFYKFLHIFITLLRRTVFEPLARLFLFLLHHQSSTLVCLHNRKLFQLAVLMCSVSQENPYVLSYLASLRAMRNMMFRHDFLAHLSFFSIRSCLLHSNLRRHLSNQNSQSSRLLVMYRFWHRLPPQCSLSWLFLALDLVSLCESWIPCFAWPSYGLRTSPRFRPGLVFESPVHRTAKRPTTEPDCNRSYMDCGCGPSWFKSSPVVGPSHL